MALTKVKAGNIILTTPSASSNDVTPATTQYVTTALANLADSAPSTLNTLNELAAALGDDANFSTTVTNSIAAKLPLAGGTLTGDVQAPGVYIGSTNTSYDLYNNGTTYLNGSVVVDDNLTVSYLATTSYIDLNNSGNRGKIGWSGNHTYIATSSSVGSIIFKNNVGSTASPQTGGDTLLTIADGPKVGIGTDSPASGLHLTGGNNTTAKLTLTNTAPSPDNTWSLHPIYNGQDLLLNEDSDTRVTFKSGGNVLFGGTTDRSRKFVVEGTGDLMSLYSTNAGAGGAQLDLIHDSASYADGDSVGIVNFATDDRQLTSIKGVGAASGERGVFHIGVRKSASEYNHNAMRLHNGGDEVLLDIYSPSGSNRGAGYFRFKTDGSGTEESVAQIYMEQGSGDGGSRKSAMYFQVADNGAPSTAMTIENNKYISTASHLNVATSTPQSSSKLTVNGGIRFNHFSAGHGLNCVSLLSFNNSNTANPCGSVYYKMFILNIYHNNGHTQALFLANGGGGVGYRFTSINAGDSSIRNGIQDFSLTTIGSQPNTFRIQISNGGGALTVSRTSGTGSFQVAVHILAGG